MVMFLDKPRFDLTSKAVGGETATAGEVLDATLESMRLVDNAGARVEAMERAYDDRIDVVRNTTGQELPNPERIDMRHRLAKYGSFGPLQGEAPDPRAEFQAQLEQVATEHPEQRAVIAPERPILQDAIGKAKAAEKRFEDVWSHSDGGTAAWSARLAGGLYGSLYDPVNVATLAVGPAGKAGAGVKGLLWMGLKNGAANAGTEALIQPFVQQWRKEAGLDHGLGLAAINVAGAGTFGFGLDAGVRSLWRVGTHTFGGADATPSPKPSGDAPPSGARLPKLPEGTPASGTPAPAPVYRGVDPIPPMEALEQAARNAPEGSVLRRASEGDEDALRELAAALGPDADPAIRRALDELELEKLFPTPLHVDDGAHLESLARAIREESGAADLPAGDAIVAPIRREVARLADEVEGIAARLEDKPVAFRSIDPAAVTTDASTFQFKSGGDVSGVTDRLRGVTRWDPVSAGKAIVFERADGSLVIADGHQRLGLAKRVAASGQDAKLDAYVFREADGWTPEDVRAYAALKNMRESSGTSVDMAQVMRDRPDLIDGSLPLTDAKLRDAAMLARLSPEAFDAVVAGRLPPPFAALIGESVADASRHRGLLDEMAAADLANTQQARLYLKQLMELPTTTETQMTLFGEESFTRTVLVERAQVLDSALRTLRADKRIFGLLEDKAAAIEGAGNVLAWASNAAKAERAAQLADLIEKLATSRGPVAAVLNDAAASVARGLDPRTASRAFVDRIADILEREGLPGLVKVEEAPKPELAPVRMDDPLGPEAKAQADDVNWALELDDEIMFAIRAFHGTPHDFDRFDLGKIGTGEGAQVFGHGLYFAESEGVARYYLDALSTSEGTLNGIPVGWGGKNVRKTSSDDLTNMVANELYGRSFADLREAAYKVANGADMSRFDRMPKEIQEYQIADAARDVVGVSVDKGVSLAQAADEVLSFGIRAEMGPQVRSAIAGLSLDMGPKKGAFYEVDIDAEPHQLLDHDAKLADQPDMLAKLEAVLRDAGSDVSPDILRTQPGSWAYSELEALLGGADAASKALKDAGIPGLRYLDQGSRGPAVTYDVGAPREDFGPYSHFTSRADAEKHLETLRSHGFADAEIKERQQPQSRNIVIFDDSLIKITHKNGKAVSAEERQAAVDAMFGLRGFYSPAIRAAESISMKKGTGEQFLKQITKVPGVRKDELEWMGLEEFLAGKPSVTRDEVLSFMRAHQVELDEKVLQGKKSDKALIGGSITPEQFRQQTGASESAFPDAQIQFIESFSASGSMFYVVKRNDAPEYQVLSKDLEKIGQATRRSEAEHIGTGWAKSKDVSPRFGDWKVPGGENYRELLIRLPKLEGKYTSKHFQDQEIVHLRVDDRTGPGGEKVLFINEVQSDLHQAGRQKGYDTDVRKKIEDLRAKLADIATKKDKATDQEYYDLLTQENSLKSELTSLEDRVSEGFGRDHDRAAPNAPFKGDLWLELALKRALLYASENGYDAISWARSDQIAKAVGAPFVNEITWRTTDDGIRLSDNVRDDNGKDVVRNLKWGKSEAKAQQPTQTIAQMYGEDIAAQVRSAIERGDSAGEIGGLNLPNVGMHLQYDQKIGRFLRDYTKKWGAKVEEASGLVERAIEPKLPDRLALVVEDYGGTIDAALRSMPDDMAAERQALEGFRDQAKKLSPGGVNPILRITPEMRASVMEGQPLAVKGGQVQATPPRNATLHNTTLSTRAADEMASMRAEIDKAVTKSLPAGWRAEIRQRLVFGDLSERIQKRNPGVPPSLEIEGTFDPYEKIIYVSMAALDPVERAFEEAGHALKSMRLIPEADYGILQAKAKEIGAREKFRIDERYGDVYGARWKDNPARLEEALEEEAIMQMVAARARGDNFGRQSNVILDKLIKFLRSIRDMLGIKGFRSFEDVFEDMTEGGFARQMDAQRGRTGAGRAIGGEVMAGGPGKTADAAAGASITQTPAFRKWFGGSKAVGADGAPLPLYHGTQAAEDFESFKPHGGFFGTAISLSPDPFISSAYATGDIFADFSATGGAPRVLPVYAKLENPYVIYQDQLSKLTGRMTASPEEFTSQLKAKGYDGVLVRVRDIEDGTGNVLSDEISEIAVFDPTQIKSVFNRGTFDPTDPRISFSIREPESPTATDASFIARAEAASEIMFALGDEGKAKFPEAGGEAKSTPERQSEAPSPSTPAKATAAPSLPGGRESKRIRNLINQAAAEGKLPREDADALIQRYDALEQFHKDGGKAKQQIAKELTAEAEHRKRQKDIGELRRRAIVTMMTGFRDARGQADPAKAMQALIENLGQHELPQGFTDVAGHQRAIYGMALADLDGMLHEFRKTLITGQTRNKAKLSDVVRELHGEKTGDDLAAGFAQATAKVMEDLRLRFNAAGGNIAKRKDWSMPQSHDKVALLKAGKQTWVEFVQPLLDLKWMKHPLTGDDMPPAEVSKMLGDVWDNLVSDGWHEREASMAFRGLSAIANTRADPRSLIFANADAWMKYSDRFGSGDDALAIIVSHIRGMTKDIAAMEVLGPNPKAMLTYMGQFVEQQAKLRRAGMPAHFPTVTEITGREFRAGGGIFARDPVTGYAQSMVARAENMWNVYSGASSAPVNATLAAASQTVKNINVATKLGGATVSALSDPFWQVAARKFAGLPTTKIIRDVVKQIGSAGEREARRAGVIAETYLHLHNEGAREGAALSATKISAYVADRVLSLSMLNAVTRYGNHAMSMGIQGHLADMAGKAFADLDPRLQRMFRRWGLEATDWDAIRLDTGGRARDVDFLSPADIRQQLVDNGGDPSIAERYLAMTLGEAQYATLTGSIRGQAIVYGSLRAGTAQRELWSMFMQFKSFAVNLAILQLERIAREFVSQGFWRGAQYATYALTAATLGGALIEQLQQLRNGKDPRDMTTPEFWGSAAYRSGGLSIWGDLLYASENRFGGGVASTIAGPSASTLNDILNLTYGSAKKAVLFTDNKERTNFGREATNFVKRYTPGASLWYVRAAWERVMMDNLQRMVDPEADASFRRKVQNARKDYKQDFWWKPGGGALPQRGPRLGAALPLQ